MQKFFVLALLIASFSACSVEIITDGNTDRSTRVRESDAEGAIAQDCMGEKGWCVVTDHDKIEHIKPNLIDDQIHAALRAHPDWVREAILADPQIIADAQNALMQRKIAAQQIQARKALMDNHDAVFADPADPVIGNPDGDVTIVELFDPDCPYCRQLAPILDQLIAADPGVRLVLKDFPILGPGSEIASRFSLAAIAQGKYAQIHAALMASTLPEHQIDEPKTLAFAASAGLDVARLKHDAAAPEIMARIAANRDLARKLGINGTPGLIIGDQIHAGMMTLDSVKKAVADARAKELAVTP